MLGTTVGLPRTRLSRLNALLTKLAQLSIRWRPTLLRRDYLVESAAGRQCVGYCFDRAIAQHGGQEHPVAGVEVRSVKHAIVCTILGRERDNKVITLPRCGQGNARCRYQH